MVDVDPQDGAGQPAQVLAVAFGVFLRAGITRANIQESVRAKRQHAAPVQVRVLMDLQQSPGRNARVAPQVGGRLPLDDHRREETALIADVVVHVVLPVFEEPRMKRDTHHALEFTRCRFVAEVGEQFLPLLGFALFEAPDLSRLLFDDEKRAPATGYRDNPNRMVEPHLVFVQRHEPDWFFDRRNLTRHAREPQLGFRLLQRLEISDQVRELIGLHCLVHSGGHQRRATPLLLVDLCEWHSHKFALHVEQLKFLFGSFAQNTRVHFAIRRPCDDRTVIGVDCCARFQHRLDQLLAPVLVADRSQVWSRAARHP